MAKSKKAVQASAARDDFNKRIAEQAEGQYETVESGKNLKFEVGDEIEGRILTLPYTAGKSAAFDIEVEGEDGTESLTYWCPTILKNMLKKIRVGDEVIIKCLDMISTSNGDAYDFGVARKVKG